MILTKKTCWIQTTFFSMLFLLGLGVLLTVYGDGVHVLTQSPDGSVGLPLVLMFGGSLIAGLGWVRTNEMPNFVVVCITFHLGLLSPHCPSPPPPPLSSTSLALPLSSLLTLTRTLHHSLTAHAHTYIHTHLQMSLACLSHYYDYQDETDSISYWSYKRDDLFCIFIKHYVSPIT